MSAKHRLPLFGAVFGALLLSLGALADAPSDQYSFFTKDRQEIRDSKTKLHWARYVVLPVSSVNEAESMCAKTSFGDAGGPGWRAPTVKELLTIVDEDPHNEALPDGAVVQRAIDRNAFPGTPVDRPYIAAAVQGTVGVWVVDFGDGTARFDPAPTGNFYVRCVLAE